MISSLISSLFGNSQERNITSSSDSVAPVPIQNLDSSPPPALTYTFSAGSSIEDEFDSAEMASPTDHIGHTQSSELSFVTAPQTESPPLCDFKVNSNAQMGKDADRSQMQPHEGSSQLKKTRYSSPDNEARRRNRYELPKYTPEGLKPRRSIEEISASLGICLLDINAEKPKEQICDSKLKTTKKTNVSFSSYHTIYKVSSTQQGAAAHEIRGRRQTTNAGQGSMFNHVSSPNLSVGEARTAVGLLLSQKDTKSNITYESENRLKSSGLRFAPPPARNSLNKVSILPPMRIKQDNSDWRNPTPQLQQSSDHVSTSYKRLHDSKLNRSLNESFCSSACDESLDTKSQDWYNEWYQYEKYKDDQDKTKTGEALNESYNTYNSRQALFEKEPSDLAEKETQKDVTRAGYDFSPVDGPQYDDEDDPFIVNGVNNSWISDISQNTSSQVDHQRLSPQGISNLMDSQNQDPSGPGPAWSRATANLKDEELVPNELKFESKYESKRLEKEHLIAQVVSRLSDNISLVHDVELMNTGFQGKLTPRTEMDKDGVLTGYSTTSRSRILSALHRTLVTYDPSKSPEEQNLEQYHAMYFIGTLINLTAKKGFKNNDEGRWKPKGWVRDAIVSELVQPTNEEMDVSTLSESSNNYSLGASTISSKHSSPRQFHKKKAGTMLSQTISAVSALLQNISVLLDDYMTTSSPNSLDRLVGTYVHLLGIPRENLTKVTNAFTYSSRPSKNTLEAQELLPSKEVEAAEPLGERKQVEENSIMRQIIPDHSQHINVHTISEAEYEEEYINEDEITVSTMDSGPSILRAESFDKKKSAPEMPKVPHVESSFEETELNCDKENNVTMDDIEQKLEEGMSSEPLD